MFYTREKYEKDCAQLQQTIDQDCQLLEKLTKEKAELTVRYKELSREIKRIEKLQDGGGEGDQTERLVDLQMQIDDVLSKRRSVDKSMKGLPEKIEKTRTHLTEELPKFLEEQEQLAEKERLEALREEEAEEAQQQEFLAAAHKIAPGEKTPYQRFHKSAFFFAVFLLTIVLTIHFLRTSFDYKTVISFLVCIFSGFMSLIYLGVEPSKLIETDPRDDTFTTRVAGVTYKNDNGSSRQRNLRKAKKWCKSRNIDGLLGYLEFFYFEGEPALSVKTEFGQIGNIPRESLPALILQFRNITKVIVQPDSFTKNGETVYRADIAVCIDVSQKGE